MLAFFSTCETSEKRKINTLFSIILLEYLFHFKLANVHSEIRHIHLILDKSLLIEQVIKFDLFNLKSMFSDLKWICPT